MKIRKLKISGFRSIDMDKYIELADINIFIGKNNSGKSSILKSLYSLQKPESISVKDIRLKCDNISVLVEFDEIPKYFIIPEKQRLIKKVKNANKEHGFIEIQHENGYSEHISLDKYLSEQLKNFTNKIEFSFLQQSGNTMHSLNLWTKEINNYTGENILTKIKPLNTKRPNNYIVPFFAQRKVTEYNYIVNTETVKSVEETLKNLPSHFSSINQAGTKYFNKFRDLCNRFLDLNLTSTTNDTGFEISLNIDNSYISLNNLGSGISHVLGLLIELITANNKLILIEELENDLHPELLKKLLSLIIEKSTTNQFLISTHSNIVLKHLGAYQNTKIFKTKLKNESRIPFTEIDEIITPDERFELLEELGYELYDFDIWEAWIIFEESTIETIVKKYLIPEFCPSLVGKLRTIESKGVGNVKKRFDAINNLFVFLHLAKIYINKVWVIIDEGIDEKKILDNIKLAYVKPNSWKADNFIQLKKHDFEDYYPSCFKSEVIAIKRIKDTKKKRTAKRKLLIELIKWIDKQENNKRLVLEKNFKEIIDILKNIEKQMFK